MEITDPDWQEMDKAVFILEKELSALGYLPSRKESEEIYIQLRKLALDHARIEN